MKYSDDIDVVVSGVPDSEPRSVNMSEFQINDLRRDIEIGNGYSSRVSEEYFKDWDKLQLNGNPELKARIRNNLIASELNNHPHYERFANHYSLSIEEFKRKLQERVELIVGNSNFFVASRSEVLKRVLIQDGRWKSQFETGNSRGLLNPKLRALAELKMFGFNHQEYINVIGRNFSDNTFISSEFINKDVEKRPIYGYFSDHEHGIINEIGQTPPFNSVQNYGEFNVKVRRDIALLYGTLTWHDSLAESDKWPPSPCSRPHFASFPLANAPMDLLNSLNNSCITNWHTAYTEVQFHGGLNNEDIESIHISPNNFYAFSNLQKTSRIFNLLQRKYEEELKIIRGVLLRYNNSTDRTIKLIEY